MWSGHKELPPSMSDSAIEPKQGSYHQVQFRPLSPDSRRTLQRHHQEVLERSSHDSEKLSGPSPSRARSRSEPYSPKDRRIHPVVNSRQDSDDDEDEVVYLPDRFDSSGRPLPQSPSFLHPGSSYSEFMFLPPQQQQHHHPGDLRAIEENPRDLLLLAHTIGGLLLFSSHQRQGGLLDALDSLLTA
ncbi:hypothetical protein F5Y17DRAFT_263442 [Xylariaceae sp. FL0594]|nr:hypothetical protein F5Y17DRAFT_263442 [Xylariaceae sp. FL0594]